MSFGLTNVPKTFMRSINHVLRERLKKFVVVYFDDILIYNISLKLYVEHLCVVLNVFRNKSCMLILRNEQFVPNKLHCWILW